MTLDLNQFINSFHLSSIFKIGILAIIVLFVLFLIVVFRQVLSLNSIVIQSVFGGTLAFIAILLIIAGISLFVAALVIL